MAQIVRAGLDASSQRGHIAAISLNSISWARSQAIIFWPTEVSSGKRAFSRNCNLLPMPTLRNVLLRVPNDQKREATPSNRRGCRPNSVLLGRTPLWRLIRSNSHFPESAGMLAKGGF
jgi:hypothetical protein